MKRFAMMSPKIGFKVVVFIILTGLFASTTSAQVQDPAPISAHVTFLKSTYNLDDPNENIGAVVTIKNNSPNSVWTKKGFSEIGYHLHLYFYGPLENNPKLLRAITSAGAGSATPSVPPSKEPVEELYPGTSDPNGPWFINMDITELRDYYPLDEPGQYKVWFSMPFIQYDSEQVEDVYNEDNTLIIGHVAPPDAVVWTDPIDTQETFITLVPGVAALTSDIRVVAMEYTFGEGPRSGMTKKPLSGVEVRLYETSAIETAGIKNISYKTYAEIANHPNISYKLAKETGTEGEYIFRSIEQSDYVVITYASPLTDYRHIGSPATISASDSEWGNIEIVREIILLTNYRGKKSPGKSITLTGSELRIIQPEYVEWDSSEELYPIGFESLGNWEVDVSLETPLGFVADQNSLSEPVSSELKGLQFTISYMNGEWKPIKIKYKVKHKKKTQEIYSEIGIKLTRKLAKEMGIDEWGEVLQEEKQQEQEETQEEKQQEQEDTQEEKQNSKKGRKK